MPEIQSQQYSVHVGKPTDNAQKTNERMRFALKTGAIIGAAGIFGHQTISAINNMSLESMIGLAALLGLATMGSYVGGQALRNMWIETTNYKSDRDYLRTQNLTYIPGKTII